MANIYGKLKAVTADGVLADAEQIEETATGKSVAVALKDLRRAVQGQIDPSVINVDAYTKKETDDKIEALSKKIVTVDPEISDTSENPVQNKAVKSYVDNMRVKVVTKLPDTGEDNLIYAVKKQSLKYIPYEVWYNNQIDFNRTYSLYEGRSGIDYYTYIADDGESFSVGDYLSDSLSTTLYEISSNGIIYVLIHNTADDTYISKKITAEPDGQKPIKDSWRYAFKIKSVADEDIVVKVFDDVVPPVTYEITSKLRFGFILRKTTYVLYTYNSGKWQQLGAKFTSDLVDIDSLNTKLEKEIQDVDMKSNYIDKKKGDVVPFNTIHFILDNPEYLYAIVDADDKLLFGLDKKTGTAVFGVIPEQIEKYVDNKVEEAIKEIKNYIDDKIAEASKTTATGSTTTNNEE